MHDQMASPKRRGRPRLKDKGREIISKQKKSEPSLPMTIQSSTDIQPSLAYYKKEDPDSLKAAFERVVGVKYPHVPATSFTVAGAIARIAERGLLNDPYIQEKLENFKLKFSKFEEKAEKAGKSFNKTTSSSEPTVDFRLAELWESLEQETDRFLQNGCKSTFSMEEWLKSFRPSYEHLAKIREKIQRRLDDVKLSFSEADDPYGFMTRSQKLRYCEFLQQILTTKKPRKQRVVRKKRQRDPEKVVKKVKIELEDKSFGLKGLPAIKIIGAEAAVVWDAKYRNLTIFHAKQGETLDIRGSSVVNWDQKRTQKRKIRKPQEFFKQFLAAYKQTAFKIFENLKVRPQRATGLLNNKIILKVY
jgi:hypothetical protein